MSKGMDKFEVMYETSSGDVFFGWCYATSILEAERLVTYEYFDLDRILALRKI